MVGHDGHRGWLYYLAVADDHRRRGVGRALVAAAEEWLAEQVPKAHLMVRDDNAGAVAFYERLGYARQDTTVLGRRLAS
jgi:ribosomal protein S18 acetylase RimI-like enzyme